MFNNWRVVFQFLNLNIKCNFFSKFESFIFNIKLVLKLKVFSKFNTILRIIIYKIFLSMSYTCYILHLLDSDYQYNYNY